jgi:hypothetical protein
VIRAGASIAEIIERARRSVRSDEEIREHEVAHGIAQPADTVAQRLEASGILPSLALDDVETIRSPKPSLALRHVQRWEMLRGQPGGRPWIWLCSDPGHGKTIAGAVAIKNEGGRYVRWPELLATFASIGKGMRPMTEGQWRSTWARPGLVVVDEFGLETARERDLARHVLHEFVDVRQRFETRTMVLTNKSQETFEARAKAGAYDGRTHNRIPRISQHSREGKWIMNVNDRDMRRTT